MKQTKTIITNTVFALQILLLFLLLFEGKLQVPVWLQPVGRMHPLLLHLPIGLIILLVLLPSLKREISTDSLYKLQSFTLHVATLTASLTALMGLFLAQEEGYTTNLVNWHKWAGVGVSFLTAGLLLWHNQYLYHVKGFNIAVIINGLLLIIAGHLGATITHGEDYILAPIRKNKPVAVNDKTPIYVAAIQPILEAKCYNCHNESKAKGELIMTSLETLLKGGKNGALWLPGNADSSLLLQRVKLPLEHEDHMPPKEKPQLTAAEIQLIQTWIQAGANVQQTLADIKSSDTLYALVNKMVQKPQATHNTVKKYDFKFAADKKIKALNHAFCSVYPIAVGSPALHAEIFVRQAYQPQFLQELAAVQEQLVSLNLTNMPIQDEDLNTIAQFKNLEKLILNGTNITGQTLAALSACASLHSLSLSSTAVDKGKVSILKNFPALKQVYVWNTRISAADLEALKKELPNIQFDGGYEPNETEVLQLSPPLLKNKSTVLVDNELVTLENKLSGVTIRYTKDGTDPDSLRSSTYTAPFRLDEYTVIKAKSFKQNWKSSDIQTFTLFPKGHAVQQAELRTTSDPQYQGKGAASLYDGHKGDVNNFRSPLWLGFREQAFDAYFYFEAQVPTLREITLSFAQNIYAYCLPPAKIEIWGGDNKATMQQLASFLPKQPNDYEPNSIGGVRVPIPASSFRCYRVVAHPVARLPVWHNGKGDKAWLFVDEVFFY